MSLNINLALQGGGAHGAFTWGVLDTLLQDEEVEIAAISGTSAGALNAAALKAGMVRGGRDAARENLDWLWKEVGAVTDVHLGPWVDSLAASAPFWAKALEYSPGFAAFDLTTRMLTPGQYGPLLRNPLERIVRQFRYDAVCTDTGPAIFIGATNVRSGKIRIFAGDAITPEAILASACLPTLFEAVEIYDPDSGKTEAYWDGGYTGNPALFPLFDPSFPSDIVVVNINPLYRESLPQNSQEIANRINEISFNSSLLRELRAIEFVQRLLHDGAIKQGSMKDVHVHMIAGDALMNDLNVATKTIPTPVILSRLKQAGQVAAKEFLQSHRNSIGKRSSIDLAAMFS